MWPGVWLGYEQVRVEALPCQPPERSRRQKYIIMRRQGALWPCPPFLKEGPASCWPGGYSCSSCLPAPLPPRLLLQPPLPATPRTQRPVELPSLRGAGAGKI